MTVYFVSFLLPVVAGTSFFLTHHLIPEFLLKKKTTTFFIYLAYTVIISLYFEMLMVVFSFIVLADYNFENLPGLSTDLISVGTAIYLIAAIQVLIYFYKLPFELEKEEHSEKTIGTENKITVRSDRKNVILTLSDITFIESLGDYLRINLVGKQVLTKKTLTSIDKDLPQIFLRVHRSFIVNLDRIDSQNHEWIMIDSQQVPIGRTFRKTLKERTSK